MFCDKTQNKYRSEDLLVHTSLDEATAQNFRYILLRTWQNTRLQAFPALHTTASCDLYALLENN